MEKSTKLINIRVKYFFIVIFSINLFNCVYAQDSTSKATNKCLKGITVSYIHHEVQFFSMGGKLLFISDNNLLRNISTGICMDVSLNACALTLAPRVYLEFREKKIGGRANLIN